MPDKPEIPIAEVPEDLRLEYESRVALDGPRFKHRITYLIERIARSEQALAELRTQLSQEKERSAALCEWLGDLYDRWENGTPCYEDPEESSGFLGNAFKLEADEEDALLKMLPPIAPSVALQSENARLTEALRAAEANADFLRKSVGAAHMMISRGDLKELDGEWDATDLPPRLKKYITGLCERLGKPVSDEEWSNVYGYEANNEDYISQESVDALLAARRTQERGNGE